MNTPPLASRSETRFVTATGLACLRDWYDPLVRWWTCESQFKDHLLDNAQLRPGEQILDVGCGSGTLALALAAKQPAAHVIAMDPDRQMLAQAQRKRLAEQVEWQIGNALQLEFSDETFDHVFCTLVLHHLQPMEKRCVLCEIWRILRPGGNFHLADFGQPTSWRARFRFLPVRLLDGWGRTACNIAGRLPSLLQTAGFTACHETLAMDVPLGTIRCHHALKAVG